MARPSKPDHIKEAQGTLRPCRVNSSPVTSEPLSEIPDVPGGVSESGHGYFHHACEILLSNGVLTASYIPTITRGADIYARYVEARDKVVAEGAFQTAQSGYTAKSGAWTVMVEAHKLLLEFEREYGLTLVSSQKISVPTKPKDNDDFD